MYCTIIEKQSKKKPSRSGVYRKIEWKPYSSDPLSGYWHNEDEIQRDPREKWDITINHSYRKDGQVNKKQYHIETIKYWDIVNAWYSESICYGIEGYFKARIAEELDINKAELAKEKKLASNDRKLTNQVKEKWKEFERLENFDTEYKNVDSLIYAKFQPIIDRVTEEYKKSEEYRVKSENDQLKKAKQQEIDREKEYQKKKYETDSIMGQGYYDAHYNRDGTFNSKGARDWEKTHKQQEQGKSNNNDYSNYFNFNTGTGSSLTADEKSMAEELIISGYKALAKKYHPDIGGKTEDFQKLGSIKDKIDQNNMKTERSSSKLLFF